MRSQRYAVHIQANKDKKTLREWEEFCKALRNRGVDTEDETVFIHGYGDCFITDLIYEQAVSVIRVSCSAAIDVAEISTDNGPGEPMETIYKETESKRPICMSTILDRFEEYNERILDGTYDGYPPEGYEDLDDEDESEEE